MAVFLGNTKMLDEDLIRIQDSLIWSYQKGHVEIGSFYDLHPWHFHFQYRRVPRLENNPINYLQNESSFK